VLLWCVHALISLYFSFDKQLYCSFIDFQKAFDKVWRAGLWQTLLKSEIKGKCFNVIFNMYQNIKSCVNRIVDVMVSVLASGAVDREFEPDQVKPKTIKLVFVASPLSTKH
jgi:hypothetical protein